MPIARNYITSPTSVSVTHSAPVGGDDKLVVCSFNFEADGKTMRLDDIFNCNDSVSRAAILECTPEKPVQCVVTPDSTEDSDGHPSIDMEKMETPSEVETPSA